MIAALAFEPPAGGVRRARFVPRARLAVEAACRVAEGVREVLDAVLGAPCTVALGEPVALAPAAWRSMVEGAFVFLVPGTLTDVAVIVRRDDARTLVAIAFGEDAAPHDGGWSALEAGALERIVARCAPACEAVTGARRGTFRAVDPAGVPACADFVDLRVAARGAFALGIATLRALPEPPPARTIAPAVLGTVPLDVRVTLGRLVLDTSRLLDLRKGDVLRLHTKVAGEGELNVAGQRIASGTCGVRHGVAAFDVWSTKLRGDAP